MRLYRVAQSLIRHFRSIGTEPIFFGTAVFLEKLLSFGVNFMITKGGCSFTMWTFFHLSQGK